MLVKVLEAMEFELKRYFSKVTLQKHCKLERSLGTGCSTDGVWVSYWCLLQIYLG